MIMFRVNLLLIFFTLFPFAKKVLQYGRQA